MSEALKYRRDIDGLRAVAVMAVVLHHLSASLVPGGYVGVDVFFVISGYLITKIIHAEMSAGTFTFARFYERRVRRIFPALAAVLAAVLVVGWFVYLPSDYLSTLRAAIGTVFFSANIVFWKDLQEGYFASDAKLNPLLHMWSLGVEEQFYIGFPVVLLLCMRYARPWVIPAFVAGAAVSLALAAALVDGKSVAVFFLSPFRGWEMLAGCIVAIAPLPQPSSSWRRELMAWFALLAIVVPVFAYTIDTVFPGLAAVPPVLGAALLIHLGSHERTMVSRVLSWPPAVSVGLLSYSLYLWHWPVIVFAKYLLRISALGYWVPLLLVLSLALAWLSYHWVETPFRRIKGRSVQAEAFSSILTMLVLLGLCIWGVLLRGVESRWPAENVALDRVRTTPSLFERCEIKLGSVSRELCVIGDPRARPDALLWGDSHILAWLPGFDSAFRAKGRSALVAGKSACPPLTTIESQFDSTCQDQVAIVIALLKARPDLHQVILAGFWAKYFSDSNIVLSMNGVRRGNSSVAPVALQATIAEIATPGREVSILGPVPTYSHDISSLLARDFAGQRIISTTKNLNAVHRSNSLLYETIGRIKTPRVTFFDVASWLCTDECKIYDGGPLYRDSNHLSDYGSRKYSNKLVGIIAEMPLPSYNQPATTKSTAKMRLARISD